MNIVPKTLVFWLSFATSLQLYGQGLIYDQQSAAAPEIANYDNFSISRLPLYQALVPSLSSIGFVQLELWDYLDQDTSGAHICVGLFSGSPGHLTFVDTTATAYFPPNFNNDGLTYSGVANFHFANPITLVVGQTYYISPIELTGDSVWSVAVLNHTYPYGQLYANGTPFTPPVDLWFREGIVVPEPSGLGLLTMGGWLIAWILGLKKKQTTNKEKGWHL